MAMRDRLGLLSSVGAVLLATFVAIESAIAEDGPKGDVLPQKILSGYSGVFLGHPEHFEVVKQTIADMSKAGFNSYDCKVQQSRYECDLDSHVAEVADLAKYANERGVVLQFYLYPVPFDGKRNEKLPAFRELPYPIDANGIELKDQFLIADARVWKKLFCHAYAFARHRKEISFAALKFDIETIPWVTSYDDATWKSFCAEDPRFDALTPLAERRQTVSDKGVDYERFFVRKVAAAVKEFADELHAIDKTLSLGYMPARESNGGYADVFDVVLATPEAPAVIDGWDMYNGGGYRQAVKDHGDKVKRRNPNNRFVCWFRVNSYEAKDMTSSAYHTAANVDGYSMWSMTMLTGGKVNSDHQLPAGLKPSDYFEAFCKANAAVRADIAEGKAANASSMTRIPYVAAKPLVAPLKWDFVDFPDYVPAGDGTGPDREAVLRDVSVVYVYAKVGEEMSMTIRHVAGLQRGTAINYILLCPGGKTFLRHEAVVPASADTFKVVATSTGVHALVLSGGEGGEAWYGVNVHGGLHWGVDTRRGPGAYFFRPQTVYVPGSDYGHGRMRLESSVREAFTYRMNGGPETEIVYKAESFLDLPKGVVEFDFEKSPKSYCDNLKVSFPQGGLPLAWVCPERRLEFNSIFRQ